MAAPHNGNGLRKSTFRIVVKLAHQALKDGSTELDLPENLKVLCATNHLRYDSDVVHKAIDSALVQRQKVKR